MEKLMYKPEMISKLYLGSYKPRTKNKFNIFESHDKLMDVIGYGRFLNYDSKFCIFKKIDLYGIAGNSIIKDTNFNIEFSKQFDKEIMKHIFALEEMNNKIRFLERRLRNVYDFDDLVSDNYKKCKEMLKVLRKVRNNFLKNYSKTILGI